MTERKRLLLKMRKLQKHLLKDIQRMESFEPAINSPDAIAVKKLFVEAMIHAFDLQGSMMATLQALRNEG